MTTQYTPTIISKKIARATGIALVSLEAACAGWGHLNPKFAFPQSQIDLAHMDNDARKFLRHSEKTGVSYEIKGDVAYVDIAHYNDFVKENGLEDSLKAQMPYGSVGDAFQVVGYKEGKREVLADKILISPEGTVSVEGNIFPAQNYTLSQFQNELKNKLDNEYDSIDVNYVNGADQVRDIPFAAAHEIGFADGSSTRVALGPNKGLKQIVTGMNLGKDGARFVVQVPGEFDVGGKTVHGITFVGDYQDLRNDPSYGNFNVPHEAKFQDLRAPDALGDFFHVLRTATGFGKDTLDAATTYQNLVNKWDELQDQRRWRAIKQAPNN